MAAVRRLTCSKCGRSYYWKSKCSCEAKPRSFADSASKKIQFLATWLLVLVCVAGVVFALAWYTSLSYGLYRSGILIYFAMNLGALLIFGYLHDQYEAGQGDYSWRTHWLMPNPLALWYKIKALKDLTHLEQPWGMAVAFGILLGAQVYLVAILSPGMSAPSTAPGLAGAQVPGLPLPLVSGGEFSEDDLQGRTTVMLVRSKFGSSPSQFLKAWEDSVSSRGNPLPLVILIMDQYGEVEPFQNKPKTNFVNRYPTMIGRKWLRERFGNFQGDALVVVIDRDGRILQVWEEVDLGKERAGQTIDLIASEFADDQSP